MNSWQLSQGRIVAALLLKHSNGPWVFCIIVIELASTLLEQLLFMYTVWMDRQSQISLIRAFSRICSEIICSWRRCQKAQPQSENLFLFNLRILRCKKNKMFNTVVLVTWWTGYIGKGTILRSCGLGNTTYIRLPVFTSPFAHHMVGFAGFQDFWQ